MNLTEEDFNEILNWLIPRDAYPSRKPQLFVDVFMPTYEKVLKYREDGADLIKMKLTCDIPNNKPFWWMRHFGIYHEVGNERYIKKIDLIKYDDYGRLHGAYIRTDAYPLLWTWFEFLALLDIAWHNIIKYTWRLFKFLNKGQDFIPHSQLMPNNPLEIAMLFGLNGGK